MRIKTTNKHGEVVEHYRPLEFLMNITPSPEIVDWLLEKRVNAIRMRDVSLAAQKEAAKNRNFEAAKEASLEAKENLRHYRAICLYIPWFMANPPGDCQRVQSPTYWPVDLEESLDDIGYGLFLFEHALPPRVENRIANG